MMTLCPTSDKMMRDLVDAEVALRKDAERKEAETRAELIRVGTALCRDALSLAQSASPKGTLNWTAKQLADLIIDSLGKILDDVDLGQAGLGDLYRQAATEVERLKQDNAALRSEIDAAHSRTLAMQNAQRVAEQSNADLRRRLAESETGHKQLQVIAERQRQQMEQLRKQLAATPTSPVVAQPELEAAKTGHESLPLAVAPMAQHDEALPEWIQEWQHAATFERERALVKLIGDTGECRRNKLAQELAQQLSIDDPRSGSIARAVQSLADLGLISVQEVKGISRGRAPNIVLFTDRGGLAYQALFNATPSRLYNNLLARHSSPEHLYLNLEGADLLREAGYEVDLLPPAMTLADGSQFEPDLAAISSNDKTVYVECERDTRKNDHSWIRKWEIMCMATNGVVCVVTPDQAAMKTIGNEIRLLMGKRNIKLFMTNLDDVRGGKRSEKGGIWLVGPSRL